MISNVIMFLLHSVHAQSPELRNVKLNYDGPRLLLSEAAKTAGVGATTNSDTVK